MATGQEIWNAAKAAVREVIRKHRPSTTVWTTLTPQSIGTTADSWERWAQEMVEAFNDAGVKISVTLSDIKRRSYWEKPFIEFVKALRDA